MAPSHVVDPAKRILPVLGSFAAFLIMGIACAGFFTQACKPGKRAVEIAFTGPMTGDTGTEGEAGFHAVQLAVSEANASGKFPFEIEAVPYDDGADADQAVRVANLIVLDPRVAAVIGPYNSGCAIAAAPIYARASIPILTPSATAPELTDAQLSYSWKGPRNVFRLVATDRVQGEVAASYVYKRLGLRRVAVVHESTPYGEGLAGRFKAAFLLLGGRVTSEQEVPKDAKDFSSVVDGIERTKPQGLYFGGVYTDGGLLLSQLRARGLRTVFISGDGARTPALFDVAGSAADGAYFTMIGRSAASIPAAKDFLAAYEKRWPGTDESANPYSPAAYEATQLVLNALGQVGPDRAKLIGALHAVKRDGLLGPISFDEKGDLENGPVAMTRADAKNRKFVVLP